jgi:hypothetical protein
VPCDVTIFWRRVEDGPILRHKQVIKLADEISQPTVRASAASLRISWARFVQPLPPFFRPLKQGMMSRTSWMGPNIFKLFPDLTPPKTASPPTFMSQLHSHFPREGGGLKSWRERRRIQLARPPWSCRVAQRTLRPPPLRLSCASGPPCHKMWAS